MHIKKIKFLPNNSLWISVHKRFNSVKKENEFFIDSFDSWLAHLSKSSMKVWWAWTDVFPADRISFKSDRIKLISEYDFNLMLPLQKKNYTYYMD